uniref:Uncharacterized protein n=1 Tax=Rhizophora mucronata TaxID=61149 RepID=A0A2P2PS81_RHIMU
MNSVKLLFLGFCFFSGQF